MLADCNSEALAHAAGTDSESDGKLRGKPILFNAVGHAAALSFNNKTGMRELMAKRSRLGDRCGYRMSHPGRRVRFCLGAVTGKAFLLPINRKDN